MVGTQRLTLSAPMSASPSPTEPTPDTPEGSYPATVDVCVRMLGTVRFTAPGKLPPILTTEQFGRIERAWLLVEAGETRAAEGLVWSVERELWAASGQAEHWQGAHLAHARLTADLARKAEAREAEIARARALQPVDPADTPTPDEQKLEADAADLFDRGRRAYAVGHRHRAEEAYEKARELLAARDARVEARRSKARMAQVLVEMRALAEARGQTIETNEVRGAVGTELRVRIRTDDADGLFALWKSGGLDPEGEADHGRRQSAARARFLAGTDYRRTRDESTVSLGSHTRPPVARGASTPAERAEERAVAVALGANRKLHNWEAAIVNTVRDAAHALAALRVVAADGGRLVDLAGRSRSKSDRFRKALVAGLDVIAAMPDGRRRVAVVLNEPEADSPEGAHVEVVDADVTDLAPFEPDAVLSPDLVRYAGTLWRLVELRSEATCAVTEATLQPGEWAFRPLSTGLDRGQRIAEGAMIEVLSDAAA